MIYNKGATRTAVQGALCYSSKAVLGMITTKYVVGKTPSMSGTSRPRCSCRNETAAHGGRFAMPISVACEYCGKIVLRYPCQLRTAKHIYCSKNCRGRDMTSLHDGKRQCTTCKEWFPASPEFFNRQRNTKLGLTSQCRTCLKTIKKKFYENAENSKQKLATTRRWKLGNGDKIKKHKAASYVRNRESVIEKSRKWRQDNPEKTRTDPDKQRKKNAIRRARMVSALGEYSETDLRVKCEEQNGRCYYCNAPLTKYHADHVVPLSRGGTNYAENIVLACPTCNLAKGDKDADEFKRIILPIVLRLSSSD